MSATSTATAQNDSQPEPEISLKRACAVLGCTPPVVARFVAEGRIRKRSFLNERGAPRVLYLESDVHQVARTWQRKRRAPLPKLDRPAATILLNKVRGAIAQIALPMFEARRSLTDIVVATGADPTVIQQLYDRWKLGLDAEDKLRRSRAEIEEEKRLQRRHDKEQAIERKLAHERELARLEKRRGT